MAPRRCGLAAQDNDQLRSGFRGRRRGSRPIALAAHRLEEVAELAIPGLELVPVRVRAARALVSEIRVDAGPVSVVAGLFPQNTRVYGSLRGIIVFNTSSGNCALATLSNMYLTASYAPAHTAQ